MLSLARRSMSTVTVRVFQATWESVFPKPVPLSRVPIDSVTEGLLDAVGPLGLIADQITLIKSNELYGYELRFPLFRGNASYSQNAQRVRLDFMNAVGHADVTTIIDTILKCLGPIAFPAGTKHSASVGRQCEFESPEDFKKFFMPDAAKVDPTAVKQAGSICYVTLPEWLSEIVVTLDRSISIKEGIWVHTKTSFEIPALDKGESKHSLTAEALREAVDIFEKAVSKCNLQLSW